MFLFNEALLKAYEQDDQILRLLRSTYQSRDGEFKSHQWLLDSVPKRMIYFYMYKGLFESVWPAKRLKVLDVGGGYCSITRIFLDSHDYVLLDPLYELGHEVYFQSVLDNHLHFFEVSGKTFWLNYDWYRFEPEHIYDIVIANDLFPNVDQRLDMFIEKFIPVCKEIRLSLTYYNQPKFYPVKRLDGDETFQMLAWTGKQVKEVLEKYSDRIPDRNFDILTEDPPSIFPNGRHVCMVCIKGDR